MELFFWTAFSLFVSLVTLITPMTPTAVESYTIPLQITGLADAINEIAFRFFPEAYGNFDVIPTPPTLPTPPSSTWDQTPPKSTLDSIYEFVNDSASDVPSSPQQIAVKALQNLKPLDLLVVTCGFVVAVAIYVAITQWKTYRLCKKNQAEDRATEQTKDQIERFDAKLDGIFNSVIKQKTLLVQGMKDAAQELQNGATSQAKDFEETLATMHSTADQTLEDAKQVQVQFQEQMAALKLQKHLDSQVREFETYLAVMKGTADNDMENQSKQLRDHIQEQMTALKPQELLESRMLEFETDLDDMKNSAGQAVENVKQLQDKYQEQLAALQSHELPERLMREFEDYLEEMKGTAGKAMDDEAKRLRGQFEDHGAAFEQQKKDLKAEKRSFDTSLTQIRETATKKLDSELKRVHDDFDKRIQKLKLQDRIDNQMSTFMADLAKMKKDAEGHLSDRIKQLANDFRDQVRASFANFFSKDAFEQLVKEVLTEQLNSALSDLSSGNLAAFLQQKLGDMVKEQAKSSLPAPGATHPAPFTPARPQSQMEEAPNAPEKPSQGAKSSRRHRKTGSKSSTADPQGNEKEVPETGNAPPTATHPKDNAGEVSISSPVPSPGLQTSQWAPPTGPRAMQARDKGKQPVRNETKEISISPSQPSLGLQSSQWAPPTGPRALQNLDKGKQPARGETKEVSGSSKGPSKGLQGSRFAPPKPNPESSTQDKGKQPEKDSGADGGKRLSGTQASMWAPSSGGAQVKGDAKEARSSSGQTKGGAVAKESASRKPSAQQVEAQGSRTDSTVMSPSPAKGLIKMGAYQVTAAPPSLKPTSQTANVPAMTGTELKSPPSGQEDQKDSGEDSQGVSRSKWDIPDGPKLPRQDSRRPPPRAGLVEENLGIKKVFANLRQSRWPPGPSAPKKEVEKTAPVKKDQTKAGPGPAAPEKDSKAPVEKGQAKEGSGPAGPPKDAAKSVTWSDLVEEEMEGSSGASGLTGAAATTDAPPAGKNAPTPPAATDKPPVKDGHKKGDTKLVSPGPVSPGLAKSMWADPSPAEEASKGPSAGKEEKRRKISGLGASRWAD